MCQQKQGKATSQSPTLTSSDDRSVRRCAIRCTIALPGGVGDPRRRRTSGAPGRNAYVRYLWRASSFGCFPGCKFSADAQPPIIKCAQGRCLLLAEWGQITTDAGRNSRTHGPSHKPILFQSLQRERWNTLRYDIYRVFQFACRCRVP